MKSYQQGETVPKLAKFYNANDELFDVSTCVITFKNPSGTIIIDEASMTHDSLGTYSYNYDLESDADIGMWKIICKAVSDNIIVIRNDSFRVVP